MICYNWKIIKSGALPPVKIGDIPMKTQKDKRGALIWIPLGILLMLSLWYFMYDFILSFKDFQLLRGVLGSPSVGLENYERMLYSPDFSNVLGNSVIISLRGLFTTLPLGVLFAFLFGLIKSRPVKAAIAGVMLMLALVPELFWANQIMKLSSFLVRNADIYILGDPKFFWIGHLLCKIVPATALCVFGGLCLNLAENKNAIPGALVAGLLPLLSFFTPDFRTLFNIMNPTTYGVSDSISTYIYRQGITYMDYSYCAAVGVFSTFLNVLVGIGFAFLLAVLAKRKKNMVKLKADKSGMLEGILGGAGALIIGFFIVILNLPGKTSNSGEYLASGLSNTVLSALLSAIFIFGVCSLLFSCSRYCRGGFGFAVIALILTQMSLLTIADYLIATNTLGLANTIIPGVFSVLTHPTFVAVLVLLAVSRPTSARQMLFTSGGAALIAAAVSAGDYFPSMLFIRSSDKYPLSVLLRRAMLTGSSEIGSADGYMTAMLVIVLVFAALGAMMTFAGLAGSRLQSAQETAQKPAEEPSATDTLYGAEI